MKRSLLIITVAFVVTFTAIFTIRASADALAVVFGVVLGVVATVPTTVLVTYVLTRPRLNQQPSPVSPLAQQPPVVVINAPDKPAVSAPPVLPALTAPAQSRKWTVIGDTETET